LYFGLQSDTGSVICCYATADGFTETLTLDIFVNGHFVNSIIPTVTIPELVHAGRHATGECGYVIDDSIVPELASITDISVFEQTSGLLVYRRKQAKHLQGQKIFRLETQLLPLSAYDTVMSDMFQYAYRNVHLLPRESIEQICVLPMSNSIYSSGRIHIREHEYALRNSEFKITIIVREPFFELAERLMIFKRGGDFYNLLFSSREQHALKPVTTAIVDMDIEDTKALSKWLQGLSAKDIHPLRNPLTRMLACSSPNDDVSPSSVGLALDVLSTFDFVGLRNDIAPWNAFMEERLGLPNGELPIPDESPKLATFAARLRNDKSIKRLLEHDLELYRTLSDIYRTIKEENE
jgi:hypothetical protein